MKITGVPAARADVRNACSVGIIAIAVPEFFSFVITQLIGALCLVTGFISLFQAIFGKNRTHRVFASLSAIIRIAAGSVLLFFPVAGVAALAKALDPSLNAAELGRALALDQKTASRYVDILCGAFLVRRLPPWFENTGKRLVKAPKVYLRDTGLLHALLGLRTPAEVRSHPRLGASWEGFALEHAIGQFQAERDAYFWGTHGGAELDLLITRGGAMADLKLKRLFVVYPGTRRFELDTDIIALPLTALPAESAAL